MINTAIAKLIFDKYISLAGFRRWKWIYPEKYPMSAIAIGHRSTYQFYESAAWWHEHILFSAVYIAAKLIITLSSQISWFCSCSFLHILSNVLHIHCRKWSRYVNVSKLRFHEISGLVFSLGTYPFSMADIGYLDTWITSFLLCETGYLLWTGLRSEPLKISNFLSRWHGGK